MKYVVYITIHASLKLVLHVSDVGQTNEYLPLHVWIRFMGKRTSLKHGVIQHYYTVNTHSPGPILSVSTLKSQNGPGDEA